MITLHSVHFDDRIPNWSTRTENLTYNIMVLVLDGTVSYRLNEKLVGAEKGDFLLLPAGTSRSAQNTDTPHQKLTALFYTDGNDSGHKQLPIRPLKLKIKDFDYVHRRFFMLYQETLEKKPYFESYCISILTEILSLANRQSETADAPPSKVLLAHKMQQALHTRYRERIQTEELARLTNRSPNYSITIFKEVIGVTPLDYVHELRIKEACRLLTESTIGVAEISDYLGFYDTSHFYRIFKKITGLSPSAYAERTNRPST
ncbi:AraC family transcriptional regulator [Paenibacillus contaminans]|uniref:AraC family transcriptional regulator n=1 Tax=Paenibacillus contaminans TaxID=450362 RepID=A0A329MM62_9BACL|nr:AraC family transcriptional regulator [Paenibacillus contaminans]RAV20702.1 AraC family transcriptional regulator [Paenibacillus contaminans]